MYINWMRDVETRGLENLQPGSYASSPICIHGYKIIHARFIGRDKKEE